MAKTCLEKWVAKNCNGKNSVNKTAFNNVNY